MGRRELLEDPEVLVIVRQVAMRARRTIYAHQHYLADDLESWLTEQAPGFAQRFEPLARDGRTVTDPECDIFRAHWYVWCWSSVTKGWHASAVTGHTGTATRDGHRRAIALEHPLGDGFTVAETLQSANADPLHHVLRRERLEELIERAEDAPTPVDDGLCDEPMCPRPKGTARGLCSAHWQRERALEMPECSSPGCERPGTRRGLCQPCWQRDRDDNPDVARCATPGCPKATFKNGHCNAHHSALQRAARKENNNG